ncbi:hypothetical protein PGTUg99_005456 [Puccinia graminis f. sp. tritici]|uniref:Cytochrome c oxidase polypeptide VIIA n=1 Tax=Puccinia graminis f. sp. tritici TaxID=56615 RepID=A0A5B0SAZ9_PUCGR|nr:hypothetical protein PGTUg99_005456 [Puccinia graminis f. sp. tritici]
MSPFLSCPLPSDPVTPQPSAHSTQQPSTTAINSSSINKPDITQTGSKTPSPKFVMAIAPITGKLRKRILLDLSVSLGLGTAAAYTWWYGYHVPKMRHQQNVYAKINSTRAEQES